MKEQFRKGKSAAIVYTLVNRAMGSHWLGLSVVGAKFCRIYAIDEKTVAINVTMPGQHTTPHQASRGDTLGDIADSSNVDTGFSIRTGYLYSENSEWLDRKPHDSLGSTDPSWSRLSEDALQTWFNCHNAALMACGSLWRCS